MSSNDDSLSRNPGTISSLPWGNAADDKADRRTTLYTRSCEKALEKSLFLFQERYGNIKGTLLENQENDACFLKGK
jgi:hypothetical protein